MKINMSLMKIPVLLISGLCFAYIPFPTDSTVWTEVHTSFGWSGAPVQFCGTGDTIRDTTYHSILGKETIGQFEYSKLFENGVLTGFLREDLGRKVFFKDASCDSCSEIILYDFSLETNDTVVIGCDPTPENLAGCNDSVQIFASAMDTIHLFGQDRRRWFILHGSSVWIEGIGNAGGLLHQHYFVAWDDMCRDHIWELVDFRTEAVVNIENRQEDKADMEIRATPNPFNPATSIEFNIEGMGKGILNIFNASGRRLFSREVRGQGRVSWNAAGLASGTYLVRLATGGKVLQKKVAVVR